MTPMSDYLQTKLTPFLIRRGVADAYALYTADVIEQQGVSLLRNWEDAAFRKAILLLGAEEGLFYEPAGRADVKCFVVTAIRNSPIETTQSKNYQEAGLTAELSNEDVKAITGSAIRYFNPLDFSKLCREAKDCDQPDLYRDIVAQYPVAWTALQALANTSAKVVDYPAAPVIAPYQFPSSILPDLSSEDCIPVGKAATSSYDGYTPQIDKVLLEQLQAITAMPGGVFWVDAFKVASRNFEKLLQIMEYVLTRETAFATTNYYIESGHVERRMRPLRAAHTLKEMYQHATQVSGLGHKHTAAMKEVAKGVPKA